jgi:hypothetical protein
VSVPNFDPISTLGDYVNVDILNASHYWGIPYSKNAPVQNYIPQMEAYYAWFELATLSNAAYWHAAMLEFIAESTTGLRDKVTDAGDVVAQMVSDSEDDLKAFLSGEFLAAISSSGSDLTNPIAEIREALKRDVAGSILGIDETLLLGIAKDTIAKGIEIDASKDNAALLANVIAGGLERLAEAAAAQGGQDFNSWLVGVTPHSPPNPQGTVVTTENVSPFMKMGTATFGFLIEKTGNMLSDIMSAVFKVSDAMSPAFTPLIDTVINQVEERASSLGEVTPNGAFPLARKFIEEAFRNGLKARLISILLEKAGDQVKNLGIQQIAGLVGDLSGFSQLAEAVHGTQLKAAVARPAEYQINAQVRSKLLNESQLIEGAIERKISLEEQRQIFRYHGYTEHHIDIIQAYQWRDPRLREIILLASDASVDDDDVRHWLAEAGYEDRDIERIAPVVIQQSNRQHRQALTSEVMANLQEGFLSDEDAEAQFTRLSYSEEAIRLLMDTGRFRFRREVIQEHITELESMFNLEQIAEPEFRLALAGLGVRQQKVDAIVGKAVSKFSGRVSQQEQKDVDANVREYQRASLATLKAQFQAGLIPAETFYSNLVAVGFVPQIATEIVSLEQIKALTKVAGESADEADKLKAEIRRARMKAFIELYQESLIDAAALQKNLLALGMDPDIVYALVIQEQAKKGEIKPATP